VQKNKSPKTFLVGKVYLLILTILVAQNIGLYSADVLRGLGGEVNARLYTNRATPSTKMNLILSGK
jgi:hypothetical protein